MPTVRTARGHMTPEPELTYQGLDRCDGCGAALVPEDRLSGLCPTCQPRRKPTRKMKAKQQASE